MADGRECQRPPCLCPCPCPFESLQRISEETAPLAVPSSTDPVKSWGAWGHAPSISAS